MRITRSVGAGSRPDTWAAWRAVIASTSTVVRPLPSSRVRTRVSSSHLARAPQRAAVTRQAPRDGSLKSAGSQVNPVSPTRGAALGSAEGSGSGCCPGPRRPAHPIAPGCVTAAARGRGRVDAPATGDTPGARVARWDGRCGNGGGGNDRGARAAVVAQDEEAGTRQHDHGRDQPHDRGDPGAVLAGQIRATAGGAPHRVPWGAQGQPAVPAEAGHSVIAQAADRTDDLAGELLVGLVATVPPQPRILIEGMVPQVPRERVHRSPDPRQAPVAAARTAGMTSLP